MRPRPRPRVAYQGAPGAFGEEAVARYWAGRAEAIGVPSFAAAVRAVCGGAARYAVLPVWNSSIGRIPDAWEAMSVNGESRPLGVRTAGELTIPVRHALLARAGVRRDEITTVLGHPAALAQCVRLIADGRYRSVAVEDSAAAARALAATAGGAPLVVPGSDERFDARITATLAPLGAASRYGLAVLAHAVQDLADNRTSFLVVERA